MKRLFVFITVLFVLSNINAQTTVNGILDSSISLTAGDNKFSFGIEEFANIRFQSRLRDNRAIFYGAVNLIAAAGDFAANAALMSSYSASSPMTLSPYIAGENYIAAIELERLYFRLNFEKALLDGGLFRLPFGYGQVWGSSDFLNPKNPLKPDARPRGILGTAVGIFPAGDLKLVTFAAMPRNPFVTDGDGVLTGLSIENHWNRVSAQALYSFEVPKDGTPKGVHRTGTSVKADVEVGLMADVLYTYDSEAGTELDGLSLSAGADYSFFKGKLIVLAEYLYNGETSSTAFSPVNPLGMTDRHYLFSSLTWIINDFININFGLLSCLDNPLFIPLITYSHELFQGLALTIVLQAPINDKIIENNQFAINCAAKLRLRF